MPLPPGWRNFRPLVWALFVVAALALLAWPMLQGYHAMLKREWLTVFAAFGISLPLLLVVLATCTTMYGKVTTRCTWDATGTTFWPDRGFVRIVLASVIVFIPAGALFAILVPFGALDIATGRGLAAVPDSLMIGSATLVAVFGVLKAWQRGGVGHLTLSPAGIEDANIFSTKSYTWDQIADVQGSTSKGKGSNEIALVLRDGTDVAIQGAHLYVPSGVPLYWMVKYYFSHPAMRSELSDGRAVERLNAELFDATEA